MADHLVLHVRCSHPFAAQAEQPSVWQQLSQLLADAQSGHSMRPKKRRPSAATAATHLHTGSDSPSEVSVQTNICHSQRVVYLAYAL